MAPVSLKPICSTVADTVAAVDDASATALAMAWAAGMAAAAAAPRGPKELPEDRPRTPGYLGGRPDLVRVGGEPAPAFLALAREMASGSKSP